MNDDLSSVAWWTIVQDWKTLKTFTENYSEFYVTTPWVVNITAKDSFWNELKDTLDIRQFIPWYEILEKEWTSNGGEWDAENNW